MIKQSKYYKQLDFLRFLAVALVVIEHWFGSGISRMFQFGYLGVLIFFVLSGFLITEILLKCKDTLEEGEVGMLKLLKTFYIRRTLRIFPIYYAMLLFLWIFSFEGIRSKIAWYGSYTSNIYSFIHQKWDGMIGPFWSLAVEEQFYLVWPILILIIPKRKLLSFFYGCLVFATLFRYVSIEASTHLFSNVNYSVSMRALMPSCIDSFAIGGILALRNSYAILLGENRFKWMDSKVLSFLFFSGTVYLLTSGENFAYYLLFPLLFSFLSVMGICRLLRPVYGFGGQMINGSVPIFLGKISYGLYLFHGPFPLIMSIFDFALMKIHSGFSIYAPLESLPTFWKKLVWVIYLIAIASVSFYLFERPFNKLKSKFAYR